MRRIYTFIGLLFLVFLSISGCYTTVSTKKLTEQTWLKNHRHQFFSDSKWGKEWNDYYWNPNIKKKPKPENNRTENKVIHDKDIYETKTRREYPPEPYYYEESHSSCCILDFLDFLNLLFGNDKDDDDSSTTSDSTGTRHRNPSQPQKRRGM